MKTAPVLAEDFQASPYWWQAAPPVGRGDADVPDAAEVVIVGSGYTGLCCAIELAEHGVKPLVVDAGPLGGGASTRSGALVTGGQKFIVTGAIDRLDPERQARILEDARASLSMMETRIAHYGLDADYQRCGRILLAAVPAHYDRLARWAELFRTRGRTETTLIPRRDLPSEVAGDRYHGGLLIEDYGALHPAKYHRALREAATARGAVLVPEAPVTGIVRLDRGYLVRTPAGEIRAGEVVVATNGHTGRAVPHLQRRVVPVTAYVIATEPLAPDLVRHLLPRRRTLSDTQRNLYWMRLSPDGTRLIFGTRPTAFEVPPAKAAVAMHAKLRRVWPELADVRVAFAWTGNVGMTADHLPHMGRYEGIHYALGCNGSGVAMMSYLGAQTARKLLGRQNRPCAFDVSDFPAVPLYGGTPWFTPIVTRWYDIRDAVDRLGSRPAA